MIDEKEKAITLRAVIDRKGHRMQTIVAIEELSELQKVLTKILRGKGRHIDLVEEITDVLIMIEQLRMMYNVHQAEIDAMYQYKLERLIERLLGSEEEKDRPSESM